MSDCIMDHAERNRPRRCEKHDEDESAHPCVFCEKEREKEPATFHRFEEARDFGAQVGRGFPAWHVVGDEFIGWRIECRPGGDVFSWSGELCSNS